MRFRQVEIICSQTFHKMVSRPANAWLVGLFMILLTFALSSSYLTNLDYHHTVEHYSDDIRHKWESNPDKHPHRMAHYGYVVFREQYPMSYFDTGMNSYLGNVVFLEAHRQNSINFSQASLSTGLLRFGELSAGPLLQLILPLLIFFWGFNLVSSERESGTLKLLLTQGASWSEILMGRSLGVFFISLLILALTMFMVFLLMVFHPGLTSICQLVLCYSTLIWSYMIYLFIMSLISVWISAHSQTNKGALIKLIGCWIFLTLIFPKVSQVAGQITYPTPSKIEFDALVEADVINQGDSHNPDDLMFTAIRDSVLKANEVSSIEDLPFNYSGFIMSQGEELSTMTYRRHREKLMGLYQKQGAIISWTAYFNPYIAIKNISMALSGTDFHAFRNFDLQAEEYRYNMAQTMNELQMKYISNKVSSSAEKGAVISNQFWKDYPEFKSEFQTFNEKAKNVTHAFISLALWTFGLLYFILYRHSKLSAY